MTDDAMEVTPLSEKQLEEVADLYAHFDRRYHSLAQRVRDLEERSKGTFEDDPTRAMVGIIIAMVALQLIGPLIGSLVARWQSPS